MEGWGAGGVRMGNGGVASAPMIQPALHYRLTSLSSYYLPFYSVLSCRRIHPVNTVLFIPRPVDFTGCLVDCVLVGDVARVTVFHCVLSAGLMVCLSVTEVMHGWLCQRINARCRTDGVAVYHCN